MGLFNISASPVVASQSDFTNVGIVGLFNISASPDVASQSGLTNVADNLPLPSIVILSPCFTPPNFDVVATGNE